MYDHTTLMPENHPNLTKVPQEKRKVSLVIPMATLILIFLTCLCGYIW